MSAVCSLEDSCAQQARNRVSGWSTYKSFVKLWSGSFWFLDSTTHTKQRCLGAVLSRTRTHGKGAPFAMNQVTLRANVPINQALLRLLLRLLLHLRLHLQLNLQQDPMRAQPPLQSLSLLQPRDFQNGLFTLSTRGLLSQILRLRRSSLRLLGQFLRLPLPPLDQPLQLCLYVLQLLRLVLRLHHRKSL